MFTGIVQNIGCVESVEKRGDWRVRIKTALDLSAEPPGASIACSGCCLTVVEKGADWFTADVSAETLSKTSLAAWQAGTRVNIEPSLRLGDALGGHFVFGHIDGLARLEAINKDGGSHRMTFSAPVPLMAYIAPKGSVALDGVSLTVNEVSATGFGVNVIPHTWAQTTLGLLNKGESVNLEVDMLARYVARQIQFDRRAA